MATALPSGYLCDVYRRDSILKAAALLGACAAAALAAALLLRLPIWAVVAAMSGLGAYGGFYSPPIESIFADSVSTGQRWAPNCVAVRAVSGSQRALNQYLPSKFLDTHSLSPTSEPPDKSGACCYPERLHQDRPLRLEYM